MQYENPDELEARLLRRASPAPSPELAERIISAARRRQPVGEPSGWLDILRELLMPRPALALSCCLLLGMAVGWRFPVTESQDDIAAMSDFLTESGDML